eukprot:EG_transcript_37661
MGWLLRWVTLNAVVGTVVAQGLETWVVIIITVCSAAGLSLLLLAAYLFWNGRTWTPAPRLAGGAGRPPKADRLEPLFDAEPEDAAAARAEGPSTDAPEGPRSSRRSSLPSLTID